jgi:hypothetical protein
MELGTQATRGMYTIKRLWNGLDGYGSLIPAWQRRDIIQKFEQQKGVQIPGGAKNPSDTSW